MKILLIHTYYQFKGGEDSVVEQEVALLKEQYEVEVLYFQNQPGAKGALQFFLSIWNLASAKVVKNKITEFQPDVVHIHNWHFASGPLIFRTISKMGIPLVHTIHNYRLLCPSAILLHNGKLFTYSLKQSFPWKAVRDKVYRSSVIQTFWLAFIVWFHKKIGTWKKINSFVCLTAFAVSLFQESNFGIAEEHFSIKPNFTVIPDVEESSEREENFLFIGRLSEEKGIETLINAFRELPFVLKIAGDGPLKNSVVQTAQEFSNINYLGNLNSKEVKLELDKAQALIITSICYEGMPMTILESLSAGTPVIASNLGAMSSLINHGYNGFHFEAGNVEKLKETIIKFVNLSDIEKNQIGLNAFDNYINLYSEKPQHGYFNAIYSKVVNKKTYSN